MTNVKRVVIVGGGSEAWLAAAALQVAFKHLKLDVCVVETDAARDVIGRWTLPSSRGIHGLLGVKEVDFVRATNATFKLATEHRGWQGEGSRYLHAHGEIGSDLSGTPFYRYLAMQATMGREADPEPYSLAAAAARRGRFARPIAKTALTSSFTYGYHLDDAAYRAYLQAHALKLGVRRMESAMREVVLASDGRIASVTLQDGASLEGDYFLDCSGRAAVLMQALSNAAREDWREWLPNDRMISMSAPGIADAPALTRTIASDAGWCWCMPLVRGSVAGIVYSSAFTSDDAALDRLRATIPGVSGEPLMRTFASGRRKYLWYRNCIAVGASGVELEPLAGADLHLAQLGLATFIELFPLDGVGAIEAAEYNRLMGEQADLVRDFTLAHYRANATRQGDYWEAIRRASLPERLAQKLDLFRANGRIRMFDHESFEETDWAWVLLGSGCIPQAIELHSKTHLEAVSPERFAPLRASIERLAATMPRHMDFVTGRSPA